jgi:Histone RNA hairpin-binding protein RNA-binding domain
MRNILLNIQSSKNTFHISRRLISVSSIRKQRRREQPTTPNKYRKCSRRCFDGQLRTWRRNLHQFDENVKQDPTETLEINEDDIE